jgi:hypothetical protein
MKTTKKASTNKYPLELLRSYRRCLHESGDFDHESGDFDFDERPIHEPKRSDHKSYSLSSLTSNVSVMYPKHHQTTTSYLHHAEKNKWKDMRNVQRDDVECAKDFALRGRRRTA